MAKKRAPAKPKALELTKDGRKLRRPVTKISAAELVHVDILEQALDDVGGEFPPPVYAEYLKLLKERNLIGRITDFSTPEQEKIARTKIAYAVAAGLSESGAAKFLGLPARVVLYWKSTVQGFAEELQSAALEATQMLEDKAYQRAMDGSDDLMKFLLKARDRKYTAAGQKDPEGAGDEELAVAGIKELRRIVQQANDVMGKTIDQTGAPVAEPLPAPGKVDGDKQAM